LLVFTFNKIINSKLLFYFAEIKQRNRTVILREASIIPPRCEKKSQRDWNGKRGELAKLF
jgi:hypothetical protein